MKEAPRISGALQKSYSAITGFSATPQAPATPLRAIYARYDGVCVVCWRQIAIGARICLTLPRYAVCLDPERLHRVWAHYECAP